jgi:hypothetical protein
MPGKPDSAVVGTLGNAGCLSGVVLQRFEGGFIDRVGRYIDAVHLMCGYFDLRYVLLRCLLLVFR